MKTLTSKHQEFEKFYAAYSPILSKVAYQRTGNREDAQDLCQNLFIYFYNNFEEIRNKRSWLNCVLTNLIRTYYEKKKNDDHVDIGVLSNSLKYSYEDVSIETRIIMKELFKNREIFQDKIDTKIFNHAIVNRISYAKLQAEYNLTKKQIVYKVAKLKHRIRYFLNLKGIKCCADLM